MKPEDRAWEQLRERAAERLPSNFAAEVLRVARAGRGSAPSLWSQFTLVAAMAAICILAVAVFQVSSTRDDSVRTLADWRQIASAADESNLAQ